MTVDLNQNWFVFECKCSDCQDDEVNEDQDQGKSSKLSLGRLGEQFSRYEEASQNGLGVRPYSAFVPMKRASITLSTGFVDNPCKINLSLKSSNADDDDSVGSSSKQMLDYKTQ
ncbi:PREDICTED: uncharacterized protein LOC107352628 isoform X2 [Acropora digitifera]|uniref:uncharacterized protein LOC107352628 isoform X2 n=1 Tax=Acropora digitifera TaxID=70779 RepID=UPI00077B164D|nr:PREDICTED: uncharacterized protein LOC107352628 isoform X2 [Acropora digitifera]